MTKKKLIHTNKYLKVAATRKAIINSHAVSTSRIEGIIVKSVASLPKGAFKISKSSRIALKKG